MGGRRIGDINFCSWILFLLQSWKSRFRFSRVRFEFPAISLEQQEGKRNFLAFFFIFYFILFYFIFLSLLFGALFFYGRG